MGFHPFFRSKCTAFLGFIVINSISVQLRQVTGPEVVWFWEVKRNFNIVFPANIKPLSKLLPCLKFFKTPFRQDCRKFILVSIWIIALEFPYNPLDKMRKAMCTFVISEQDDNRSEKRCVSTSRVQ